MTPGRRYGVIGLLFQLAMIGVGLTLPTWLYLSELLPRLLIRESETEFRALAAACDQAVRSIVTASDAMDRISPMQASILDRSFDIGRLPCRRYAELREYLLAQGVSQHALTALHLAATSDPSYPDLLIPSVVPEDLDARLSIVSQSFGLAPLHLKPYVRSKKFRLGEKLFHDPSLSGHRDRSCTTCHKAEFGMADAAKLEPRLPVSSGHAPDIPARNVPDLWNRDHNNVSAMLWDGRLESVAATGERFRLPEHLATTDFENLMALQSVRPILLPAEMLGEPGASNDLAPVAGAEPDPERVLVRMALRLFVEKQSGVAEQDTYRSLLYDSYGVTEPDQIRPAHLGNALAHYIEIEFQSRDTPWDQYLTGDLSAISDDAKQGALLFYGIGRCAVCHSGDVFSDFMFHSLGVPDGRPEKDLGRFYATGNLDDRYLFRTPPLRNVTLTMPYFHNGQTSDLADAIKQHLNPYRYARAYTEGGDHLMLPEEIDAVSPIVSAPSFLTSEQIRLLIAFLKALEDHSAIVPPE